MLETLPAKTSTTITNKAASSSPFAFVPRQVALASQRNMKSKKVSSETLENGSEMVDKTLTVESIDKKDKTKKNDKKKKKDNKNTVSPFLLSLAAFLQEQGFTKTLAVFRSEASIPDEFDSSNVLAFNEETYMKCVEARKCDAKSSKNDSKGFDTLNDDTVEDGLEESKGAATVEPSVKKKKKRNNGGDDSIEDTQCVNDSDDKLTKSQVKKKKSKLDVESSNGNSLEIGSETITGATEIAPESQLDETDRKSKDKKKKKSKLISVENGESDLVLVDNTANIDKKSSKKRKRMISEGNESQLGTDGRQKSEVLKDKGMENELLESEGHAGKKRKTVNGDTKTSDETSLDKKLDVLSEEQNAEKVSDSQTKVASHFNSDLEKNGKEGIAPQKSAKKQQNGSAEPKTAKAFQRVKVDEVKFADDRLQDNSYWAKGGADIGYGAKAQEVLGQVRGRDFRHEKTKKKRGSYRGGQIDLQTHSVKFNYSDEE